VPEVFQDAFTSVGEETAKSVFKKIADDTMLNRRYTGYNLRHNQRAQLQGKLPGKVYSF
jgi:hypothetical protein